MKWVLLPLALFIGLAGAWLGVKGFSGEFLYYEGQKAFQASDTDRAREKWSAATEAEPDRAEFYRALGNARHQWFLLHPGSRGAAQRGEKDFSKAAALDPWYPYYWADWGLLSQTMEQNAVAPAQSSLDGFKKALAIDPRNSYFLELMARDLLARRRFREADPYLAHLFRQYPDKVPVLAALRIQQEPDFEGFLALLDQNPEGLYQYALWLIAREKKDAAVKALSQAQAQAGDNLTLKLEAAFGMVAAGQPRAATDRLRALSEKDPTNPVIRWYLAEALEKSFRCDLAAPIYRELLADGGCVPYHGLAKCALAQNDLKQAQFYYFRVVKCNGLSRFYRYQTALEMAWVMDNAKDARAQLSALREAEDLSDNPGPIRAQIRKLEKKMETSGQAVP